MVFLCFYMFYITCSFYIIHTLYRHVRGVYVHLLHVYVTVKTNSSDIIAVENILALRLFCDLTMAWTAGRNM